MQINAIWNKIRYHIWVNKFAQIKNIDLILYWGEYGEKMLSFILG